MYRNRKRRPSSVPFVQREDRPFIDLLNNNARFTIRYNKRKNGEEYQVRIGTSPHNSLGVPVDKLEVLYEHIGELIARKEEKIQELNDRRRDDDSAE